MTLGDLRRAAELLPPGSSITLAREVVLAALEETAAPAPAATEPPETWLTAAETAELLHVSQRWCYDHAKQLGGKKLSRRCVRFSSRAVARYLSRRS